MAVNETREGITGNAEAIFRLAEWEICHTLSGGIGFLGGGSGYGWWIMNCLSASFIIFLLLIIRFIANRRLTVVALLSVLVAYGLMVDPLTGSGGLPCLWTLIFQHECWGCGLSRAGAHLMRGHFTEALTINWLIIPVTGLIAWQLAKPFLPASNNNSLS